MLFIRLIYHDFKSLYKTAFHPVLELAF